MSLDDILKKLDAETRSRMARKVPSWFSGSNREPLLFPSSLSTQQCSGEPAALYKAQVALHALAADRSPCPCPWVDTPSGGFCLPQGRIADLTGGLGVDSWAFSKRFEKVLYNEANSELAEAVKHNFEVLECSNITVSNKLLEPGNLKDILEDFKPDIIFLDPARRSAAGKKVFLLEDCQPDVLKLKEELLDACPNLLLKLSPMADITMLLQRLGPAVRELHVVAFDGECKELLVLLQRGWTGPASLTICEDGQALHFPDYYSTTSDNNVRYSTQNAFSGNNTLTGECTRMAIGRNFWPEGVLPGQILFEPGKALLKAGLFDYPCTLGYTKLAKHTHLYIAPDSSSLPGKYFRIEKVLPLQSKTIKEIARQGIAAEVSTHNVPIKAEDLKKRLHATSSATTHLFAAAGVNADYIIIASVI